MRDQTIVKRYAEAFIDFAEPRIGMDRCLSDMKSLRSFLREEKDLVYFLDAPEIPRAEKARVLDIIFKDFFSEEMIIFMNYLIVKHRVGILSDVADQVRRRFGHGDMVDVTFRTTFPLELDLVVRIKDALEEKIARKTNLHLELDPDLLGGVQIVMGNTVIDGSVRNRLSELKKNMLQTQVI